VCAGRCGVSRDVSSGGPGGAEAGEVVSLSRRETLRRLLIGGGVVASASLLTVAPAAASLTTPRQVRGYRYVGTRYFTSSGTFAKADPLGTGDVGCRAVRVRAVGGGGGGGGAAATAVGQYAVAVPGDVAIAGGAGGAGWALQGLFQAGAGGGSAFSSGNATQQGLASQSRTGPSGVGFGCGGAGGGNGEGQTAAAGGNGAAGIVIVEVYA
jgi:hypothetical protein